MERSDPAGAGLVAGTAVGLATALLAVGGLLAFREEVLRDLETALAATGVEVGMSVTALFWVSLVTGGLFRVVIGLVVGSLVGVAYGWLDRPHLGVLAAIVLVVGVLDGLTANIGLSRTATTVLYTACWIAYVPLFARVYADQPDATAEPVTEPNTESAAAATAEPPVEPGATADRSGLDRRLAAVLVGLGLLGTVAGVPYVAALNDLPIGAAALSMALTNGILTAGAVLVGLRLAPRVGLAFSAFDALLAGRLPDGRPLAVAAVAGLAVGVALVGLDFAIAATAIGAEAAPDVTVAAWKRALAVLYGGLFEEVLLRLGLLTAILWAAVRLSDRTVPSRTQAGAAIVAVALVFGAAHLPVAAGVGDGLTVPAVGRILLLNGIAGVVFGWLYWTRGLLAAMVAHLAANVVLQLLAPALSSL